MNDLKPRFAQPSTKDGVLIVTVTAEQIREAAQAYALRDEILAILDSSQATNLVLDLGQLTFVGSIGFLAFLGVRRHLASGRIVICNLSGPVREMFAVCQLISSDPAKRAPFEAAETLDSAVARLAA
jgi:anti-anti-sigma factor